MTAQPEYNPTEVEQAIRTCANRIARSVTTCGALYEQWLTANREYEQAYARSYLRADGPAHEKRYRAELATAVERQQRDVADAAYRYAERTSKALQEELRAWQSVGASVRAMYSVAGRGEY